MRPRTAHHLSFSLALTVGLLLASASPAADVPLPEGATDRLEAEDNRPRSTHEVVELGGASGGAAVHSDKTWEPIFESAALADAEGEVTIWVRRKGGPVQLKAHGVEPGDLDEKIRFIRGKAEGPVAIDCVAYAIAAPDLAETPQTAGDAGITGAAAEGGSALPPFEPDADAEPLRASLEVRWDQPAGPMPQDLWGVSLFSVLSDDANAPAYADWLRQLSPSFVRIHSSQMTRRWWDEGNQRWDADTIREAFAPHRKLLETPGLTFMMCAPFDWPASIHGGEGTSKYLPPDRHEEGLANFRAFAEVVVSDVGLPITHWEIANEWENTYEKAGKIDELWPLLSRLIDVAREVSPDAEIGGPAFTWPKEAWVEAFLDEAGDKLDFVSWHGYAAGEPTTPNETLVPRADRMGGHAAEVEALLANAGLEEVETYKTEFNVQWRWNPYERRHANNVGAAFLAATVIELADDGVDGASMWHAFGNAYGLMDSAGRLRATGQLYLWANRYAHGTRVAHDLSVEGTSPTDATDAGISVLGVTVEGGDRTVLIANQAGRPVSLDRSAGELLGASSRLRRLAITADGAEVSDATGGEPAMLPGYSVTIFTTAASDEAIGSIELPGQHVDFDF